MASLRPLYMETAPWEEVEAEESVPYIDTARRWAQEHPEWSGELAVRVDDPHNTLRYRFLVTRGQVRKHAARVPRGAGDCPKFHVDRRHEPQWFWDEDDQQSPFVLVCRKCGQELERWPEQAGR